VKIQNFSLKNINGRPRVSAVVSWEDCDRQSQEIYFETDELFAEDLACNPNAFLTACVIPAMRHGEKRILIDAEILPEMIEGLTTAMGWIRQWWYYKDHPMVRIEANSYSSSSFGPNLQQRAGMFFSGGVDSLAALYSNRLNFHPDHPWSIKDGMVVYGLETDTVESFLYVMEALRLVEKDADITLIPVYTNVRYLDEDWMFWERQFQDAVLSSIAHVFSRRFSTIFFASTYDIPNFVPCGAHPLLDMGFTNSELQIRQTGITMSRMEKIKLIADWDVALKTIRVCNRSHLYQNGQLNCGQCRKCVLTMLALLAIGRLEDAAAFRNRYVSADFLKSNLEVYKTTLFWWEETAEALGQIGRNDLVQVIEQKIKRYRIQELKGRFKTEFFTMAKLIDSSLLNGRLKRHKKDKN
jgi:hypothetical protein